MNIETECNVKDNVFFLENGKISKGTINKITIIIMDKLPNIHIVYGISNKNSSIFDRTEDSISKTQEGLFNKIKM